MELSIMRVSASGRELAVSVVGQGEPVVLVHGAFFARPFDALANQASLRDSFQLVAPQRYGYGSSSKPDAPYSMDDVMSDLNAVLDQVGASRAHVVAHSAGGPYALQLALEYPQRVHTLTLAESVIMTPEWGGFLQEHFMPAGGHLQNGDPATALDTSFGAVYGSTAYRTEIDDHMPDGWYEQALADLPHLFLHESPALRSSTFGPNTATNITQPVLILHGENSEPIWVDLVQKAQQLLPHAEIRQIAGTNHMFPVLRPAETANELASFLKSHPMQ